MKIKNIILDLGGVLLNIDYALTINSFKDLGISDFDKLYAQAQQSSLFDNIEKGLIQDYEFIEELKKLLPHSVTESDIIDAWNAMVLDFPKERLEFLLDLKKKYKTVLLSNTNAIHIQHFHQQLKTQHQEDSLEPYFHQVYFSYKMGMRKPDAGIFQKVCDIERFNPSETIFIDDSIQHIVGAKEIGINAFHLDVKSTHIIEYLSDILAQFD